MLTIGDHTIQGSGNIGRNTIAVINNGRILANNATAGLTIDVAGADFANDGVLQVSNGATLEVVGDLTSSSTATLAGEGTITATGGDVQHAGVITIGDHFGNLIIDANLTFDPLAEIQFDIGGTLAAEFDLLTIEDSLTLDGELLLSLADGFTPDALDTFEILISSSLEGEFDNVVNGGVLQTADGLGEFTVNFGAESSFEANRVVLSNFVSTVPEPTSGSLLILFGLALAGRRRRVV